MKHRAETAVERLIRGYFKGQLQHLLMQSDYGCAVCIITDMHWSRAYAQIDGAYSPSELLQIEHVFESIRRIGDLDSFEGLCAVFELLASELDKDYFASRPAIRITEDAVELEPMEV